MISKVLKISVSAGSFIYTFHVICRLTNFFSEPESYKKIHEYKQEERATSEIIWFLLINIILVSAFILQHSVMASDFVKDFYKKYNIQDLERSIYNFSSSAMLHYLILKWKIIPPVVWNFDIFEDNIVWTISSVLQNIGWFIVYSGCCMMDLSELAGVKTVYYSITGRPLAMSLKSQAYQRYCKHMRHPSFTGFLLIIWAFPIMSFDRLLLASSLTLYMILMWSVDDKDYNYHLTMVKRKQQTIKKKIYNQYGHYNLR